MTTPTAAQKTSDWTFSGTRASRMINGHDVEVYLTAHYKYAIAVDGDVVQTGFEYESDAMARANQLMAGVA